MLISGCANSLLTKYQDNQCVANCSATNEKDKELFEQPVFQTLQMFVAEFCVWGYWVYLKRTRRGPNTSSYTSVGSDTAATAAYNPKSNYLLAIPAICDICATTLMNAGLLLTPVSIYQMTRGGVVLFVGFFSMFFLKRVITRLQWMGLLSVFCGVFVVGLSSQFSKHAREAANMSGNTSQEVIVGMVMIFLAQILTASQFVVEEFFLEHYPLDPVEMVSLEGTFGSGIIIVASLVVYYLIKPLAIFDLKIALAQILSYPALFISSILIMISISAFNICGLTVTQEISATTRSTVDTSRTLGIWLVSLILGWEKFNFLQLIGFGLLVYGTLLFNGLIQQTEDGPVAVNPLHEDPEHT